MLSYTIESSATNLSAYREREITSFVEVLNVAITDHDKLIPIPKIQKLFEKTTQALPHIQRLTLHVRTPNTHNYTHVASTEEGAIGLPSHKEDIDAILQAKTTILYETGKDEKQWIDITYPIKNSKGEVVAALGAAVSLEESDIVLKKAIDKMKESITQNIFLSIFVSIILAIALGYAAIKNILGPISRLKKALESLSYTNHIPIEIESNDEVGELALAYNTMAKEINLLHNSMQEQIDKKTAELETQFLVDSLTSLPNRNALLKYIKNKKNLQLCILDVASFKDINDSYGVEIGNQVLSAIATKIKHHSSEYDFDIYRLGDDEFAIVNSSYTKYIFIEHIRQLIKNIEHETIFCEDKGLEINVSLHSGIAVEENNLLERADIALIASKKGHADLTVFNKKMHKEEKRAQDFNTIAKIKHAVKNFNFIAFYQPIVDKNEKIIKYESLVRMRDEDKIVSPFFFLDIAKKTKYYQHITTSVILQAFKTFEDSDKSFSINIEADDITNKDTVDFIKYHLNYFPDPSRVIFEIVESENIHNLPSIKDFIGFVKNQGAKIAIDD
jgi:diguanylate cyclase (GGDEF)-like protein